MFVRGSLEGGRVRGDFFLDDHMFSLANLKRRKYCLDCEYHASAACAGYHELQRTFYYLSGSGGSPIVMKLALLLEVREDV